MQDLPARVLSRRSVYDRNAETKPSPVRRTPHPMGEAEGQGANPENTVPIPRRLMGHFG